MNNLDDSIGNLLLDLQQNDPDTFKKLLEKAKEENPELFENNLDKDLEKINESDQVDKYTEKVNKN